MAGIKSDIILNDNMSAVLRDIKNNVESCLKAMGDMEKGGEKAFDDSEMRDFKETLKQVTQGLDNIESELKQAGNAADDNSGKFEKLGGVLKGVGKVAKVMGTAAVSGITAAGAASVAFGKKIWDISNDVAAAGDAIDKTSQKIGISAESYQEWGYVFERSGADVNNLQMGMKTLSGVITDAGNGSSSAAEKLTAVGLSVEDLSGKSQDQQLSMVISALQDMGTGAERTAAANDLLGRSATDMAAVLNMSAKETESLKKEAQDYGMVMSNDVVAASAAFEDSLTKLKGTIGGVKNQMIGELLPSITMIMDGFSNLVIGNEGAEEQLENGITSAIGSITEMIPKVTELLSSLSKAFLESMPSIVSVLGDGILSAIPELLQTLVAELPSIMTVLTDVFDSILSTLMTLMPEIIPVVVDALLSLVDSIITNLPLFIDAAVQLITALVQGLADAAPTLIPAMVTAIIAMVNGLIQNLPLLLTAALELIQALADGLIESLPVLIAALPQIIVSIQAFFLESRAAIMEAGAALLESIIDAMPTIISIVCAALPQLIMSMVNNLISHAGKFLSAGVKLLGALIQGLMSMIGSVVQLIVGLGERMIASIKAFVGNMQTVGGNLLKGLWNGISDAVGWVIERVKGVGSRIMNAIKGVFGIHSPSKEFAMIGDYLMQGLGNGVTDNAKYAISATQSVARDVLDAASGLSANAQIGATFTGVTGSMSELDGGTYEVMRNYAAQDSVNKFTTAQINIDMGGITNQIADGNDVDELITRFVDGVRERLSTASQGVH